MKQITLFFMAAVLLLSCSKKNNSTNTSPDPNNPDPGIVLNDNEKYVLGDWALVRIVDSFYTGSTLNNVQDGAPNACVADNVYSFKADRTYTVSEGTDTCVSGDQAGKYEWAISGDQFDYHHGPRLMHADGKLRKIDADNFVTWAQNFGYSNQNTIRTFYYKRK